MGDIKVITNNHPRDILHGWDLTKDERDEFDFINWDKVENGEESPEFFRYKGNLYYMESEGRPIFAPNWHAYLSDSFFSGILYRYYWDKDLEEYDYDRVVIARYYVS